MFRSEKVADILNYNVSGGQETCRKAPIHVIFTVGVIEFLLSSIYFAYAAFLLEFVEYEIYTYHEGLWITIIFIFAQNISGTLTKCICEYYENSSFYRTSLVVAAIFLHFTLLSSSYTENIIFLAWTYGFLGGAISSFITTYIKYTLEEEYDFNPNVYDSILQVSRALSLFGMPVLAMFLSVCYTTTHAISIFSALVANVIPFMLFLKKNDIWVDKKPNHYNSVLSCPAQMTEMSVLKDDSIINEARRLSSSSSSSENNFQFDVDNDISWEEETNEPDNGDTNSITILNPIQDYYSSTFGVKILPRIREESVCESINTNNEINIKRLSQITAKLEELNKNDVKATVNNAEPASVEVRDKSPSLYSIEPVPYYPDKFSMSYPGCCSPYKKYLWKRRWRKSSEFLFYNLLLPFFRSITSLKFYPPLISKTSITLVSSCFLTLVPYIGLKRSELQKIKFQPIDATFLLSYIGFSWCFFLIALPVVIKLSHLKIRIIYILGLVILAASMILSLEKMTNDIITLSCLLFGIGFGITSYTENIIYRDFFGVRQWNDSKGSLDTMAAILIVICYFFIDYYKLDYTCMIKYAYITYAANVGIWVVAPILKLAVKFVKKTVRYRQQENLFP